MTNSANHTATLILEDGTVFKGIAAGKKGVATGEICFNTGMTGYQEIFTDPSYFGQIMVSTNVHIGNYGTQASDNQSEKIQIAGLICKDFNDHYSRQTADEDVQSFFESNNIVVIHGVDSRSLVRHIRDKGAMNALIATDGSSEESLKKILMDAPSMVGLELASQVSTSKEYELGDESNEIKVAVLDFGTKRNILKCFTDRGARLKVFPAKTNFEDIQAWNSTLR